MTPREDAVNRARNMALSLLPPADERTEDTLDPLLRDILEAPQDSQSVLSSMLEAMSPLFYNGGLSKRDAHRLWVLQRLLTVTQELPAHRDFFPRVWLLKRFQGVAFLQALLSFADERMGYELDRGLQRLATQELLRIFCDTLEILEGDNDGTLTPAMITAWVTASVRGD